MGRLFEHAVGSGATLDREVMESLWALAPPGIDELTAVARLAESEPAEGRLILDTAPTGHFLRLVGMPGLALDWVHRIMRILLKLPNAAELDGPAALLIRLAQRLRALRERLADPASTAIILVTLDQPLVLAESHRLAERLRGRGLAPAAVLMNRGGMAGMAEHAAPVSAAGGWDAPVFEAPEIDQPTGTATLREFARRWRRVR
jgi:arsenite-transporting ATPase